jgi:protein tyrosine phosphatase (PTP) superfamily phosphohydrolase (DUF442 family)
MNKLFLTLAVAALCGMPVFAQDAATAAAQPAVAVAPQDAPAKHAASKDDDKNHTDYSKPGEKIQSEDAIVPNFHTVDLDTDTLKVYRSASPVRRLLKGKDVTPDDVEVRLEASKIMQHIKSLGINTIVSLEDPQDGDKGGKNPSVELEMSAATAAMIAFHSHPMRNAEFKDMDPKDIQAWLDGVVKDIYASARSGGVLFHCAAGHDRTGLVGAYLRITVDKWPVDRAIAEMRAMGHNWVKYSSNGGKSSWHEDFLKNEFAVAASTEAVAAGK